MECSRIATTKTAARVLYCRMPMILPRIVCASAHVVAYYALHAAIRYSEERPCAAPASPLLPALGATPQSISKQLMACSKSHGKISMYTMVSVPKLCAIHCAESLCSGYDIASSYSATRIVQTGKEDRKRVRRI